MLYETARIILEQLGGRKFIVMTGGKVTYSTECGICLSLPGGGGFCKDGINRVVITLEPSDTYTMIFYRVRGQKQTVIEECAGVYCDSLQEVFTNVTGLETHL